VGDLSRSGKLGLLGMHERVTLLNGTLKIDSKPDRGTIVNVNIPVSI